MTDPAEHFFVIGGQRCGTSYLCQLLDEHPAIEMAKPFRPEPKYFLRDANTPDFIGHYERTYFGLKPGARVRGEKSTSYMESRVAAEQMRACFPEARIIMVVRDPIERAISHYGLSVESGLESLPIDQAFRREAERRDDFDRTTVSVSPFAYLSRGRYIDTVELYEQFFPRERMAIVLYEEMVRSVSVVQRLYDFLGVDPEFAPPAAGRRINPGTIRPSELPPALEEYTRAYFTEPTARLGSRLQRDLKQWWPRSMSTVSP